MNTTDEGEWQCEKKNCGFINSKDTFECVKCRALKPNVSSTRFGQPRSDESTAGESFELTSLTDPTSLGATSLHYSVTSIITSTMEGPSEEATKRQGFQAWQSSDASCGAFSAGAPKYEEEISFPDQICRMVLMGKTGSGKSSIGNSIVATKHFKVGDGMMSETSRCHLHNTKRYGINIQLVDTPGFFDTTENEVAVRKEVMKCVGIVSPGPHALLLVVRIDVRFTEEEAKSVQKVRDLFGDKIMHHVIIVFTHGDSLQDSDDDEEVALRNKFARLPAALDKLMKEVENRYVVFNNRTRSQTAKDSQVRQLLVVIRDMLTTMGGKPYSSPFLQQCEETVLTHATQLGELLNSTTVTSKTLRNLICAGLEGRENLEQIVHTALDEQASLQTVLEMTQTSQASLQTELKESQASLTLLHTELEMSQASQTSLQTEVKELQLTQAELQMILDMAIGVQTELEKRLREQKRLLEQQNKTSCSIF